MIKRDEVKGPSCLSNAADDEPIFVLKSTDEVAPGIVREWALRYKLSKQSLPGGWTSKQEAKYYEALSLATQMEFWHSALQMSQEGRSK